MHNVHEVGKIVSCALKALLNHLLEIYFPTITSQNVRQDTRPFISSLIRYLRSFHYLR